MSDIPADLRYTREHEWVRQEADGSLVIGITDNAQEELGELVYVELPEPGQAVSAGDAMLVVESTKAASDVYAPATGTVVAVNDALSSQPERVNDEPYDGGWLVRLEPAAGATVEGLLDADAYRAVIEGDG